MTAAAERTGFSPRLLRGAWVMLAVTAYLLTVSLVIVRFDLDRRLADALYEPGRGWVFGASPFVLWVEEYGPLPGILIAAGALIGLMMGFFRPRLEHWRRYLALLVVGAILGPGLVVNVFLKDHWGRPRPRQVIEYGGDLAYRPFYAPGLAGQGKSFPCGHCSMGVVLAAFFFFRPKIGRAAVVLGTLGLIWGGLLGVGRMAQGAHFLSDVVWSLGLVVLAIMGLEYLILGEWNAWRRLFVKAGPVARYAWRLAGAGALLMLLVLFFQSRPFYMTQIAAFDLPHATQRVAATLDVEAATTRVVAHDGDQLEAVLVARGRGGANVDFRLAGTTERRDRALYLDLAVEKQGYFESLAYELTLRVPADRPGLPVEVRGKTGD